MYLMKLGRINEEESSEQIFSEIELKCLYANAKKEGKEKEGNLKEVIKLIAKLGGFMGRKSDGFPGPKPMWIGLQRLHYMAIGYKLNNS